MRRLCCKRFEAARSGGRFPILSALLTETSDEDLEEFFRSGSAHMALPPRESSVLMLALSGGIVFATNSIHCSGVGSCFGTNDPDMIFGTNQFDNIQGRGGNDTVYGGLGDEELEGNQDNDMLVGGPGNDKLNPLDGQQPGTEDTVKGGNGNDDVFANDGNKDVVDCGRGSQDIVRYDEGLGTIRNCEIENPPF